MAVFLNCRIAKSAVCEPGFVGGCLIDDQVEGSFSFQAGRVNMPECIGGSGEAAAKPGGLAGAD